MNYYGVDYDDTSLKHYGVVGMRWGVRRANKLRAKAAKVGGAKGQMLNAKANYIDANAKRYGGTGYKKTLSDSRAKTAAKVGLMGSYGSLVYNKSRAEGNNRFRSAMKGLASGDINSRTFGLYGKARENKKASRADDVATANTKHDYLEAKKAYKASKKKR